MTRPKQAADLAASRTLDVLRRVAGSDVIERLGLRRTLERAIYRGVKTTVASGAAVRARFDGRQSGDPPVQSLPTAASDKGAPFDLTPTDEQRMMTEVMSRFAADELRPAAAAANDAASPPPNLLAKIHELGINIAAIAEAAGGVATERSPLMSTLIAETLAHGDMGLALAALAPLGAVNAIGDFGSPAQRAQYLPPFVGDDFIPAAVALMEPRPRFDPTRLATTATRKGRGYCLDGTKCLVPLGMTAQLFVVVAALDGQGPRAFLVDGDTKGVTATAEPTMGLRGAGLAQVRFSRVTLPASALLGEEGADDYDYQRLVDLGRIGLCALAIGTCQAVLDYVIPYCNDRIAFGDPISHRQAVAFMIADMATELEGMRLLTLRAASRAEQGLDFHRDAFLARIHCAEHAMRIGTNGVQLLGGHGFIREHPVERWYRDLRAAGIVEGALTV